MINISNSCLCVMLCLCTYPIYAQQNYPNVKLITTIKEVHKTDPDSALIILDSLLQSYPGEPILYWYIGASHHYNSNNDKACLNFMIAVELGGQDMADEYIESNCDSWRKDWLTGIDVYQDKAGGSSEEIISANPYKERQYDKNTSEKLEVGKSYTLYENKKPIKVKLTRIENYIFGVGFHFKDSAGNEYVKINVPYKTVTWQYK